MPDDRLAARFRMLEISAEPDPRFAERLYASLVADAGYRAPTRQPARSLWQLRRWLGLDGARTDSPTLRYLRLAIVAGLLAAAALGAALVASRFLMRPPVEQILQRSFATYDDLPAFEMMASVVDGDQIVHVRSDGTTVRWDLIEGRALGIGAGSFILTTEGGRRVGWMIRSGAWEEWVGEWPAATDLHLLTWLARSDAGDLTGRTPDERETCAAWADEGQATVLGGVADIVACGERRWWVDRETGLVLRYAFGERALAEATQLALEPVFDEAAFAFPPPAGPTTPRVASAVPTATPAATPSAASAPSPSSPVTLTATLARVVLDGDGAFNPVLALRPDGRPVIASFTRSTGELRVVSCTDPTCQAPPVLARLPTHAYGLDMALSATGLPIMAVAQETGTVALVRCVDETCAAGSTFQPLGDGATFLAALALVDELPRVVVRNPDGLVVYVCGDPACDEHRAVVLDPDPGGDPNSIRVATTPESGVVAVHALPSGEVRVASCLDRACGEVSHAVVDSGGHDLLTAGVAVAADESILVPYYHSGSLRLARCDDPTCREPSITELDVATTEWWTPIGITLEPKPSIFYWSPTSRQKHLALCDDDSLRGAAAPDRGRRLARQR